MPDGSFIKNSLQFPVQAMEDDVLDLMIVEDVLELRLDFFAQSMFAL